jgi:hypothetical protein
MRYMEVLSSRYVQYGLAVSSKLATMKTVVERNLLFFSPQEQYCASWWRVVLNRAGRLRLRETRLRTTPLKNFCQKKNRGSWLTLQIFVERHLCKQQPILYTTECVCWLGHWPISKSAKHTNEVFRQGKTHLEVTMRFVHEQKQGSGMPLVQTVHIVPASPEGTWTFTVVQWNASSGKRHGMKGFMSFTPKYIAEIQDFVANRIHYMELYHILPCKVPQAQVLESASRKPGSDWKGRISLFVRWNNSLVNVYISSAWWLRLLRNGH